VQGGKPKKGGGDLMAKSRFKTFIFVVDFSSYPKIVPSVELLERCKFLKLNNQFLGFPGGW